jgi:LPXTG-motif cell wall-anchored protein
MKKVLLAACAVVLTVGGLVSVGSAPAGADPVSSALASGYGANVNITGQPLIGQAGLATATVPPGEDDGPNELILVPVAPIAVSGTASGEANAHIASEVPTSLEQVAQTVAGPYNARGVGLTEGLEVLVGAPPIGVSLVSASAVRAEAVGVCRNGTAVYGATSEVVDLNVAGTDVALNAPLTDVLDAVNALLQPLSMVADIERNEVVVNATGAAVNALHVTVLALGGNPLLDLIVGHAEVRGLQCAGAGTAQCADTQDNDGDGLVDAQDPGCQGPNGVYDPNDDDERNACVDGIDNDDPEDSLVDAADPGCTSPQDNDETDDGGDVGGGGLARTGGDFSSSAPLAMGLSLLAIAALGLRRRSQARASS